MRSLAGYPQPSGAKLESVFPHKGPVSYTRVTVAAGTVPATDGDTVYAVECGLKVFDHVQGGLTDDGAFLVMPIPVSDSSRLPGAAQPSQILVWTATVSALIGGQMQTAGAEAAAGTDLSAEIVRLRAIGN